MTRNLQLEELRRRYPVFRYESYEIDRTQSSLIARFRFSAPPDIAFAPEISILAVAEGWGSVSDEFINNAVFHVGLIELFSYWKATASPVIEIHAGTLTDEQVLWWEDLLIHGMGEFFYRNDIDFTADNFVKIVPRPGGADVNTNRAYAEALPQRSLLTIGGGRDSALVAGLLRDSGHAFTCMMLNPSAAARRIAGLVTQAEPVVITRSICVELLELNRRGFLNGHTPFSAYLAFVGAACMLLFGYSNVIVANERSSDEGNLLYRGKEINHQYSKSFRFETRFDEYLARYLITSGRYISFVRPLFELQIARLFSNFPEFFEVFKSCNRNRSNSWCGQCPKCFSVFLTMYPFVSRATLTKVFGADLFYSDAAVPTLRELAGVEIKPFECVATPEEIKAALSLAIAKSTMAGEPLPPVLEYAVQLIPGLSGISSASEILGSYGPHRIPAEFERLLTQALYDSPRSR